MNIIFTNHSQERMDLRKIARSDIERTLSNPDRSFPGKKPETVKFVRELNGRRHEVIGKWLKDQNAWLILSVWVRGEDDRNWNTVVWNMLVWIVKIIMKIFR